MTGISKYQVDDPTELDAVIPILSTKIDKNNYVKIQHGKK